MLIATIVATPGDSDRTPGRSLLLWMTDFGHSRVPVDELAPTVLQIVSGSLEYDDYVIPGACFADEPTVLLKAA